MIQYTFTCEEHDIMIAPHGNSVKSEGYIRTMPSVMSKLKDSSSSNTAKRTLALTSSDITTAHSAGSMPRGRQQVNDMRKKMPSSSDPLFTLMMMCKETESSKSPNSFVRIVTAAPFPMMMLAFDWTLDDLVRFCTPSTSFSILGIDPTFSLGAFDVTVTTYRHLLLTTKDDAHKHPTLFGPLFIHVKKDFQAYHFFASSMISSKPELAKLKCFGTDGEAALVNAFSAVFTKALHLRCFLHFRQNIEHKLRQLGVSAIIVKEFVKDIFGDPQYLQFGLVDSSTKSELDNKLASLQNKWNNLENPFNSPPEFHQWFLEHSLEVITNAMMRPLREQAGLGSPPTPYYTNDVESKNNILKQHVQHTHSQLPEFVDKMKTLITQQRSEVEKAVATYGEYRLVSHCSNLACERQKWFKMSEKQRQSKINKFMKAPAIPLTSLDEFNEDRQKTPLDCLSLPPHMAVTIWSRANDIVEDETAIVQAPGDASAYMVKSNSGQKPHYVQSTKGGGYLCDDCLGYKSAKICAHTVAASLKAGTLETFIEWYQKLKIKPNLTTLAEFGKPSTAGKKPRKGVSKKVSKQIQTSINNADDSDFTSRIQDTTATDHELCDDSEQIPSVSVHTCNQDNVQAFHTLSPPPLISNTLYAQGPLSSAPVSVTPQTAKRPVVDTVNSPAISPQLQSLSTVPMNTYGNTYGYFANYGHSNYFSPVPPPLVAYDSLCSSSSSDRPSQLVQEKSPVQTPFWVCFAKGNISRCNGCKNKIGRLPAPEDIVLQHKERVLFLNPHTGIYQLSRDARNVYYHMSSGCVCPHFSDFNADVHIRVDRATRDILSDVHLQHVFNEFELHL